MNRRDFLQCAATLPVVTIPTIIGGVTATPIKKTKISPKIALQLMYEPDPSLPGEILPEVQFIDAKSWWSVSFSDFDKQTYVTHLLAYQQMPNGRMKYYKMKFIELITVYEQGDTVTIDYGIVRGLLYLFNLRKNPWAGDTSDTEQKNRLTGSDSRAKIG